MSKYLVCMTAAAALAMGGQASAQTSAPKTATMPASTMGSMSATPPASAMGSTSATPPASATDSMSAGAATSASAPAASAKVAVGLSVKDKTGAMIGTITDLKPDTAGNQMATIKMGTDSFAVAAANLGVEDGVATVNASRAEILDMMKKPKT